MSLPRFDFRAAPVDVTEDGVANERRYRAEVERAFRAGDMALTQVEAKLKEIAPPVPPPVPVVPDFATEAQALAGTSDDTIISPATLKVVVDAIPPPPVTQGVPPGAVMHFAGGAPTGWLVCDGQVAGASFPALRTYLLAAGSPYGTSGADPLVPDLRGEFIRGLDAGRDVDVGRVLGSAQADAFQNHGHTNTSARSGGSGGSGEWLGANDAPAAQTRVGRITVPVAIGVEAPPRVDDETRPRNVALLPCIKT